MTVYIEYVLIDNIALRKLVNAYSDYPLRIYLYMLYALKKGEKKINQKTLCEVVGLASNTRYVISDSVDALINGGFIKVRCEYENNIIVKNGVEVEHNTPNYYYVHEILVNITVGGYKFFYLKDYKSQNK